jgi:hypothetical protein
MGIYIMAKMLIITDSEPYKNTLLTYLFMEDRLKVYSNDKIFVLKESRRCYEATYFEPLH